MPDETVRTWVCGPTEGPHGVVQFEVPSYALDDAPADVRAVARMLAELSADGD